MAQQSAFIFLLPLFLLPLIVFIFKVFKSSKIRQLPPGPTPWPVIGNIFQMGEMPHITLTNFAKTYGPLMSLRLGTKCLVVGSSPSAAIEILKNHDRILSGRHVPNAMPSKRSELDKISLGWASECNNEWRYLRTLCRTELFSGKVLESQACLREKKLVELVEFLRIKGGQVVNIGELVFATVLNMLSNVLISKDMVNLEEEAEDGGIRNLVRQLVEAVSAPNMSDFYPILGKLDLQGLRKKARYVMTKIRSNWEPILEERRNNKESGSSSQQDFLEAVLSNGFTNVCIHQLFVELLSAGSDTSTSTIEWAMAELIKNVESMKKVQDELEIELNGSDYPKESQLLQMSYVQACVKETLRLHPPAPLLLPHRAIETCQLMSYTIPKDAQIFVNVWAITRDPLIWEEPELFRPQRFLSSDMDFKGNDFEFFPFGAGRRICPGLPMAAIELFGAGSDTSTSTIEWAMAELIKNVETMKKVQDELEIELSGSAYPKESQLLQMSCVQACVKETLRLHPPAPFLVPHRATETCQVMNYTIPKDAQILVNVWAIARDPLIWEDPELFRPERSLSSDVDFKGNNFEFLPFGAGRRICPGLPMAAIKVPLVLASLVHFFDWELPHGKCPTELDMTEKFGITLQKKEPLLLIPRARK